MDETHDRENSQTKVLHTPTLLFVRFLFCFLKKYFVFFVVFFTVSKDPICDIKRVFKIPHTALKKAKNVNMRLFSPSGWSCIPTSVYLKYLL